ncbi:MAG: SMC-Scp complex subunit ScpB [Candidatus Moraniibacteriota bacterium]
MELEKIKSIIESLLFASGESIKISKLAKICGVNEEDVENALEALMGDYANGRGLSMIRIGDSVQLVTNSVNAGFVAEMMKSEIQENLSQASLEVLSIVAYRGPISRAEIEAIRGVNCSFTLRALSIRGLVDKIENVKDNRRYLYNISFDFLKKIGMEKVEKLPDWETLSKRPESEEVIEIKKAEPVDTPV